MRAVFIITPSESGQRGRCFKLEASVSMETDVIDDHGLAFKKI
jgi:hypothetical protein